jgi:acetoin utilization deacetylase AcuC-like enzyme
MTTQLYSHDIHLRHITPPGHPECVDRLKVIDDVLSYPEFDDLVRKQSVAVDESLLELVHPAQFLEKIRDSVPEDGIIKFADDTYVSPDSWESVMYAVGASIAAIDAVFKKDTDNAFAAVRPPGHHAGTDKSMGFCLVNNIAISARYAQQKYGIERVAIVDWDVHHGNGTQEIFYNDPSVMFASTHQMPLYPGTGAANETGVGNIHNVPLRQDDDGDVLREAFNTQILPEINDFSPDLILVSAGFDAHFRDPLGGLKFTADDFDWATGKLMEMATKFCDNRLVSLLEGGYDLQGLGESTAAHVNRLMRG